MLLALVTLALALFASSDGLAWLLHENQLPILARGGFAVAAMGFQSALMRESLTGSCPTTVMTGNLTQVVIDVVDHIVRRATRSLLSDSQPRFRLTPVASALAAFAFGAVLGGWLTRAHGSISVALPTAVTAALTINAWQKDSRERRAQRRAIALRGDTTGPGAPARDTGAEPSCEPFSSEIRLKVATPAAPNRVCFRRGRSISGIRPSQRSIRAGDKKAQ
jgi:hypothetical protein